MILDVVYNHTAEGNHLGPTLSFRGIDNASYYKLVPDNPRFYWDSTGTGNTLNLDHPRVLQMVLDSLRHWVEHYHVDGFRFDLASSLAREPYDFRTGAGFLRAIAQDPVLNRVKLIAEPWDLGDGGYPGRGFPPRLERMERPVPRHDVGPSGAATPASCRSWPASSPARARSTSRPGGIPGRRSTSSAP